VTPTVHRKSRGVVIRLDEQRESRDRRDDCPQGLWLVVVVTLLSLVWQRPHLFF